MFFSRQKTRLPIPRQQVGAHRRNGRTSSTTLSHDESFVRTARQFSSVSVGPRQPACASAWLSSVRLGDGQPRSLEQVEEVALFGV